MLSEEAGAAILLQWGVGERAEQLGYPSQSFYCADHASGYRDHRSVDVEADRLDRTLAELRRNYPPVYARLRKKYVDLRVGVSTRGDLTRFCEIYDTFDTTYGLR